jgi:hypothetical protein
MRPYPFLVPLFAGVLALAGARAARAEGAPPPDIEADPSVGSRWPGLVDRVHDALDGRDDLDGRASVKLTVDGGGIVVEVVLPDGRSATRFVARPEDVVPTLEALLLVPRRSRRTVSLAAAEPARPSAPEAEPSLNPPPSRSPAPVVEAPVPRLADGAPGRASGSTLAQAVRDEASRDRPGHLRIELSLAGDARYGDGQTGLGLGAISFLEVSGWLAGFEGRIDRYQRLDQSGGDGALELGLAGGHRFRFEAVALDLITGLAVAFQGTSSESRSTQSASQMSQANPVVTTRSSTSDLPRLSLAVRANFGPRSVLRTFVGVDGEIGLSRPNGAEAPDAQRLPVWTLGLDLGATVGTL